MILKGMIMSIRDYATDRQKEYIDTIARLGTKKAASEELGYCRV